MHRLMSWYPILFLACGIDALIDKFYAHNSPAVFLKMVKTMTWYFDAILRSVSWQCTLFIACGNDALVLGSLGGEM